LVCLLFFHVSPGMVAFPYTYAAPSGCTSPIAVRFAGLIQTTSNAAITFTATRPATASIARVFFRGQQLHQFGAALTADTTDAVGTTSAVCGDAHCTSWHTTSNPTAFDDFFIEVIGTGMGGFSISGSPLVWGNHYLYQPVFSQTITN
jgi:hypothetical protein